MLVPCVSPVQRCCSSRLQGVWVTAPQISRNVPQLFTVGCDAPSSLPPCPQAWQGFNVAFSAIPVLIVGVFDRDLPDPGLLHEYPALYDDGLQNLDFKVSVFGGWFANALFHSFVCFLVPVLASHSGALPDGHVHGLDATGVVMYTAVVWVVNLKLGLESEAWTWLHHLTIWGSIAAWYLFCLVYGLILLSPSPMYLMIYRLAALPQFWLVRCVWGGGGGRGGMRVRDLQKRLGRRVRGGY